jgi:hypothetical protein
VPGDGSTPQGPSAPITDAGNAAYVTPDLLGQLEGREALFASQAARVWTTDFTNRTVALTDIFSGGVPRDGISPIDNPEYEPVSNPPKWLQGPEPVISVELNDQARAFPLNVLISHEIVNTTVGGVPVAITYCPLCNSSIVFRTTIDGVQHRFGVSGFLRNSDLIMWDRATESWWQQLTGEAIVGDYVGRQLDIVPAQVVSWEAFTTEYPNGQIMNRPNNDFRYRDPPYTGYDDTVPGNDPFLFDRAIDRRAHPVDRVSAIDLGTGPMAYHFAFLQQNPIVNDVIGDTPVVIFFDNKTESAFKSSILHGDYSTVGSSTTFNRELKGQLLTFEAIDGEIRDVETGTTWTRFGKGIAGELSGHELLPIIHGDYFWFAWAAFKPDTRLIESTTQLSAG